MSKLDDCLETFEKEFKKLKIKSDPKLLRAVAKACGPSLYRADASKVSSSDPEELKRVKKNFLIKKLGLKDSADLDKAIDSVMDTYGKSNRNKYRAVVYYLLTKHFKKESTY